MDRLISDHFDLYSVLERQAPVTQRNEQGSPHDYLHGQDPFGGMDDSYQHLSNDQPLHSSHYSHSPLPPQHLYESQNAIATPHNYYSNDFGGRSTGIYPSNVDSSSTSPLPSSPSHGYEQTTNLLPDGMTRRRFVGSTINHRHSFHGVPTMGETSIRVQTPSTEFPIDQAFSGQGSPEVAGVASTGRKKRENDDDLSEAESSDNKKVSNDSARQRGRPRLDTRDETAADRRRTQIRLAQRAYRLRKETTIASLRSRVSELQNVINGMHAAFSEYNNAAIAMAQQHTPEEPTFTATVRPIAEKFFTLAKTASMNSGEGAFSADEEGEGGESQSGEEMDTSRRKGGPSRSRGNTPQSRQMRKDERLRHQNDSLQDTAFDYQITFHK